MVRRILVGLVCVTMLISASLAVAGGPAPGPYVKPCGPGYGPGGNNCAYWGDAPFPGLCGGVVALPFLVVGGLLGGNPSVPVGPPPVAPGYRYAPPPYPPPQKYGQPAYPPRYGPAYGYGARRGGMIFTGGVFEDMPIMGIASQLLGGLTGGLGIL
jgi:hypothetical protein